MCFRILFLLYKNRQLHNICCVNFLVSIICLLLQTGSTSSISGSQVSLDGSREENAASPSSPISLRRENSFELKLNDGMQLSAKDIKKFESREDEWRKRLVKKEAEMLKRMEKKEDEWKVKLCEKEKEWKKVVEKQEKEKRKLEEEIRKIETTKRSLEHALRDAEGIFTFTSKHIS